MVDGGLLSTAQESFTLSSPSASTREVSLELTLTRGAYRMLRVAVLVRGVRMASLMAWQLTTAWLSLLVTGRLILDTDFHCLTSPLILSCLVSAFTSSSPRNHTRRGAGLPPVEEQDSSKSPSSPVICMGSDGS